jgi:hypothetical protein
MVVGGLDILSMIFEAVSAIPLSGWPDEQRNRLASPEIGLGLTCWVYCLAWGSSEFQINHAVNAF